MLAHDCTKQRACVYVPRLALGTPAASKKLCVELCVWSRLFLYNAKAQAKRCSVIRSISGAQPGPGAVSGTAHTGVHRGRADHVARISTLYLFDPWPCVVYKAESGEPRGNQQSQRPERDCTVYVYPAVRSDLRRVPERKTKSKIHSNQNERKLDNNFFHEKGILRHGTLRRTAARARDPDGGG